MGEAKRRQKNQLGMDSDVKGLVVSNPIEIQGTSLFAKSSNLDVQELRAALLYWDKLVWPSSRMVYFSSGPDEQFLEDAGVLSRPSYSFNGDVAQGMAKTQIMAFQELDSREPGKWSLAQGQNSFLLLDGQLVNGKSAEVELVRAIPVPNKDVPLADILEFKAKRHDELMHLRSEIDGLFAQIGAADDPKAKLEENVRKVDVACADVLRLGKEWHFPMRLTNFKPTYEVRPLVTLIGGIGGFGAAQSVGLPVTGAILAGMGAAATATAPAVKWSFDGFEWRGLRPRLGPYRYVYHFHNEVF